MESWHPAPSVRAGLDEATRLWPKRSRKSDGTIGDAAHQARPTSDHNPDSKGRVHAFDLTHDPANGVDCLALVRQVLANRDPRLRYAIFRRVLYYGPHSDAVKRGDRAAWTTEHYDGTNPHEAHAHFSVGYTTEAECDTRSWWTPHGKAEPAKATAKPAASKPEKDEVGALMASFTTLEQGANGKDVRTLQALCCARGEDTAIDGDFGPATARAVKAVQRARKLDDDGIVGVLTWRALLGR